MFDIRELLPYVLIGAGPLLGVACARRPRGAELGGDSVLPEEDITLCGTGYVPPAAVWSRARVPALPAFISAGARSVHVMSLVSGEDAAMGPLTTD